MIVLNGTHSRRTKPHVTHAGELIDMVHCLRTDHRMPTRHRIQWNHPLAVVALDVELAEIFGGRALIIGDLDDHLVLVSGLLDQIAVILNPCRAATQETLRHADAPYLHRPRLQSGGSQNSANHR